MNTRKPTATAKATALVEQHSTLATLLAVLCLAFAVSFFFGPGSDGGSGLGGTGKFGGESGLGGTGKTPDSGPSFKLGANHADQDDGLESQTTRRAGGQGPDKAQAPVLIATVTDVPFDIKSLRLSPDPVIASTDHQDTSDILDLVNAIDLESEEPAIDAILQAEKDTIYTNALVSSLDILDGLMVAEAETSLQLAASATVADTDSNIRSRVSMPVRPERPDRLSVPTRVTAVPRTAIPKPPPVRPMRTLSTLLNH